MKKTYKILLILFFIIIVKIMFGQDVYGIEMWVYDSNGRQLSSGDEIEFNMLNDAKLELYVCFDKFALNGYSIEANTKNGDFMLSNGKFEEQKKCKHEPEHEYEYIYSASISAEGTEEITIEVKSNVIVGIGDSDSITLMVNVGIEAVLSKDASAAEIYNYFDEYLENNTNIVENILVPMDDPMCANLKAWKKTIEEDIENQKEIIENLKKDGLTYEEKNQKTGIELAIQQHEDLKKFIVEAIYKKEGTGESNVVGDEEAFNAGDDALDEYVYSHFANTEGEDREIYEFTDVLTDIGNYIPTDNDGITDEDAEKFTSKISIVLTTITDIGMVVAVLMVAVIGLKYMLGSIEEKAEYKKDMIPYLVGAGLLFGITTIVKVLQQFGETINNI